MLSVFTPRGKYYLFPIVWLDFYLELNNKKEQSSGFFDIINGNSKFIFGVIWMHWEMVPKPLLAEM